MRRTWSGPLISVADAAVWTVVAAIVLVGWVLLVRACDRSGPPEAWEERSWLERHFELAKQAAADLCGRPYAASVPLDYGLPEGADPC